MSKQYRKTCARLLGKAISSLLQDHVSYESKLEIHGIICVTVDNQEEEIIIKVDDKFQQQVSDSHHPVNGNSYLGESNGNSYRNESNGVINSLNPGFEQAVPRSSAKVGGKIPTSSQAHVEPKSISFFYDKNENVTENSADSGENRDKSPEDRRSEAYRNVFPSDTFRHSGQYASNNNLLLNENFSSRSPTSENGTYARSPTTECTTYAITSSSDSIVAAHSSYPAVRPVFRIQEYAPPDVEPVNLAIGRSLPKKIVNSRTEETYCSECPPLFHSADENNSVSCDLSKSSRPKDLQLSGRSTPIDVENVESNSDLPAPVENMNHSENGDSGSIPPDEESGVQSSDGLSPSEARNVITGHSVASLSRGPLMMPPAVSEGNTNALLKCSICNVGFDALNTCINHYKTVHRLYLCHICYKTFSQQASLQRHIRLHTGAKPYICSLCKASFYRLDSLHNHKVRIHLHSKFICPICPKDTFIYNDRGGLRQHLKVKHGIIKMAFCPCCNKCFPVWSEFLQHRKACSGVTHANGNAPSNEENLLMESDC